jgi:cobalt/nickel transport system permease protein/cobalt/nickel transport protein
MSRRTFWVAGLVVALLIAGIGSYYASEKLDGLEYVAETTGFADTERESITAGTPMNDYETAGVANERLSVGITGVFGVLVVLLIAGGGAWLLRRRSPEPTG